MIIAYVDLLFYKLQMEENSVQHVNIIYIIIRVVILEDWVGLTRNIEKKKLPRRHLLRHPFENHLILNERIEKIVAKENYLVSFFYITIEE